MKGHNVLTSSESDEYGTPEWLFSQLNSIYHFTLDPFATERNTKCPKFFTKEDNGLAQSWAGHRVFMNPPYSIIKDCMDYALAQHRIHNILIVALVPNRSDTRWYQSFVHGHASVFPIAGRIKFDGGAAGATFPSILCTYFPKIVRP